MEVRIYGDVLPLGNHEYNVMALSIMLESGQSGENHRAEGGGVAVLKVAVAKWESCRGD